MSNRKSIAMILFSIILSLSAGAAKADSIQNKDPLTIQLQNEFRAGALIKSFDDIKALRGVWLYCNAHNASDVKYGPNNPENTEGWIAWLTPNAGWMWQQDQEIQGRWSPFVPFRILTPWGLSASYQDVLGMSDFMSYRLGANNVLLAEGITLNPDAVPSDLHSPSVTTGRNDAFAYSKCFLPAQ